MSSTSAARAADFPPQPQRDYHTGHGGADNGDNRPPPRAAIRCDDVADELKRIIRAAAKKPESLEGQLPTLSKFWRVATAGPLDEPARVHFILHRLIPAYLDKLPTGRDCRAIHELMAWEDDDGEHQSLTTRYHKAAAHLYRPAADFGRRQEPRLLREAAQRFIKFDNEDRLRRPPDAAEQVHDHDAREQHAASPKTSDPQATLGDVLLALATLLDGLNYHVPGTPITHATNVLICGGSLRDLKGVGDTLLHAGAAPPVLVVMPIAARRDARHGGGEDNRLPPQDNHRHDNTSSAPERSSCSGSRSL